MRPLFRQLFRREREQRQSVKPTLEAWYRMCHCGWFRACSSIEPSLGPGFVPIGSAVMRPDSTLQPPPCWANYEETSPWFATNRPSALCHVQNGAKRRHLALYETLCLIYGRTAKTERAPRRNTAGPPPKREPGFEMPPGEQQPAIPMR